MNNKVIIKINATDKTIEILSRCTFDDFCTEIKNLLGDKAKEYSLVTPMVIQNPQRITPDPFHPDPIKYTETPYQQYRYEFVDGYLTAKCDTGVDIFNNSTNCSPNVSGNN